MKEIVFEEEEYTERIEFRLSKSDKYALTEYAKKKNISVGLMLRRLIKEHAGIGRHRRIHFIVRK